MPRSSVLLLLLAGGLLGGACKHTVSFSNERLPEVLAIAEGKSIQLEEEGTIYEVGPNDDPELRVERAVDCNALQSMLEPNRCNAMLFLQIAEVRLDDAGLHFVEKRGPLISPEYVPGTLTQEEIRSLALRFDAKRDEPVGGLGFAFFGPARFVSAQGLWLPAAWLGIDGGAGGAPGLGGFLWAGTRIRPLKVGPARPFVGAFANFAALQVAGDWIGGDDETEIENELTVGPRFGTDLQLSRHILLTLEVDLLYRGEPKLDWLGSGTTAQWLTTGGAAVGYLF